jgi:hypothetical protein
MSETNRTLRTVSSTSRGNSIKNRPNSAHSKVTSTTIQLQKREKLKSLLIEKFVKKFSAKEYEYLIEAEIADFITKEKLTEIDLTNFENHLAILINRYNSKKYLKNNFDNYKNVSEVEKKNAPKNFSNENPNYNRKTESNLNDNSNNEDKLSNFTNSALNGKNKAINFNKNAKEKNSFLKPAFSNKLNNAAENKNNIKNYNLEKSNKLVIYKNNPTVINKNISNINKNNPINNYPNKSEVESSKPRKIKESVFNDNLSRISNDTNKNKPDLKIESYTKPDSKAIFKPNSRSMSVRNLNPKNLKLEQDTQEHDYLIDLDVDDIKNFELKKLFKNEQKPLERANFEAEEDEWQAIENYKKNLHRSKLVESRKMDWEIKMTNRASFEKQMKEKALVKDKNHINELAYHEKVMSNVEKLYLEEMRKNKEIEDRKLIEKEYREMQIQEGIIKKKQSYLDNLKNDKQLCKKILNIFFQFN